MKIMINETGIFSDGESSNKELILGYLIVSTAKVAAQIARSIPAENRDAYLEYLHNTLDASLMVSMGGHEDEK